MKRLGIEASSIKSMMAQEGQSAREVLASEKIDLAVLGSDRGRSSYPFIPRISITNQGRIFGFT